MKKLLLITAILFSINSFAGVNDSAIVERIEGIYVFQFSKPLGNYDYQGTVKKLFVISGKPEEMINSLIKKCKKEYPDANAIIITSIDMDKADCITLK